MNDEFIEWVRERLEDNDEFETETKYEEAYSDGYHDAMLLILDHLKVKHNKEYRW